MGRGIIKVDLESMKELLMLPKDYEVISAAYDHESEILDVVVQSEQITTRHGNNLARVTPSYNQTSTDHGPVVKLQNIHIS